LKGKKITDKDFLDAIRRLDTKLSEVQKFARISASAEVVQLVDKLAFNDQRKVIWVHCDGTRTRTEIENETMVSHPTVVDFLDECIRLGLIEEEKQRGGHPKRVVDYVPDDWRRVAKPSKEKPQHEEVATEQIQTPGPEGPPAG